MDIQAVKSYFHPMRSEHSFDILVRRVAGVRHVMGDHPPAGAKDAFMENL
jgi:hypothetical protein